MDDFYTDEPIGWRPPDNLDDEGNPIDDDSSLHSWDYYEPSEDDESSWQEWNMQRDVPDSPDRIQQLVAMIDSQPWQITMTKSFYEQARFMEDYDDDAPIVPFNNYFPSYRSMTVDQIRSYFTIRKMLRHGQFPDVPISYIFVYVYEILMQIGINTREEGYEILKELLSGYSSESKLTKYVSDWLKDYVVYYNLKEHFAETFPEEQRVDEVAQILDNYKNEDDETIVKAVASMCKYNILGGVLFKKEPEKALHGTAAAIRGVIPIIELANRDSLSTLLIGERVRQQTVMFRNAVFYAPNPILNTEVRIAPRHRYICSGGLWTKDVFIPERGRGVAPLNLIIREIDFQLRNILHVRPYLKERENATIYDNEIKAALDKWTLDEARAEAEREAEKRKIKIDFGKLDNIREDAGVVQEKLLDGVELYDSVLPPSNEISIAKEKDEPKQVPDLMNEAKEKTADSKKEPVESNKEPVDSKEKAFLRLFIEGGDWKQYLREIHTPEGVMVENINNMAMDSIGDIVLEDSGDGLKLIEDYRSDIEEYLNDNE